MSSRNWCFTINNPENADYPAQWNLERVKLIVYQVEMGEGSNTIHLQGYLELESPRRLSYLKSVNAHAHWEMRMGSRKQALQYVTKEDTRLCPPSAFIKGVTDLLPPITWLDCVENDLPSFWTSLQLSDTMIGTQPQSSTRSMKLSAIQRRLSEGSVSIEQIADEEFDLWVRHYRAFEKYITLKTKPRSHSTVVHVLYGPTGTGKSKWCLDQYPNAYWKQRSKWWDGYAKHDCVIIDEFYGWIQYDLLLRLLDRYPLLVETKGGQLQFVASTIVITSNKSPADWYGPDCYFEALARRIDKYHFMPSLGIHATYDTFAAFKTSIDPQK